MNREYPMKLSIQTNSKRNAPSFQSHVD